MTEERGSAERPHFAGLSGRALSEALSNAPGWTLAVGRSQLRHAWQFASKEDAATFVVMAVAICFERRMLPDLSWFGLTMTVHLTDPDSRGITLRLVDLARLVSTLAGPTVGNRAQPRTGILRWLVEEAGRLAAAGAPALPPQNEEKP